MLTVRDPEPAAIGAAMAPVRARGAVDVSFETRTGRAGNETFARSFGETGGYRLKFPRGGAVGVPEGVLINTGGGMVGGDRLSLSVAAGQGAAAVMTTQAAERIYRSAGPPTEVNTRLVVNDGARLAWLPQETILFDRSSLVRRIDVDMAADATLLMCEMIVFGRTAMGERLNAAALNDQWRIRRGGELVFAEAVRAAGPMASLLSRPAIAEGARAAATVVLVAPHAENLVDAARARMEDCAVGGISGWNGLLCARFLGNDAQAVRRAVATLVAWAWRAPLPRVWHT